MKTLLKNLALVAALAAIGGLAPACSCGDDGGGDGDGDGDGDADASVDQFPALGTQIDRSGRPAISTALIAAFEPDDAGGGSTARDNKKIAYNSDADIGSWIASYSPEIIKNIAILDGIVDGDGQNGVCGDQFGFDVFLDNFDGSTDFANYDGLGTGLALDFLLLNIDTACTADPTQQNYLAVEASLVGVDLGACGGRTPNNDVVDFSYSVLVGPDLANFPNVSDGVDADAQTHSDTVFPFLAGPG